MSRVSSIRPFFTYYGGKYRAAPHYPGPQYDTIVEPFAGAAGYSVRYFAKNVVLVEKNPVVAAVWRYLVQCSPDEILRLPDVRHDQTIDDIDVCQEARWLIGFWLNKGHVQPCRMPSHWMRTNIRPNSYWGPMIRARLAAQVHYISHWRIIEGDFTDAPNVEATWFVDPPYERAGKLYVYSDVDYKLLGDWCQSLRGQVLVCENEGATWLPFRPFRTIKSTPGKHGKQYSNEVLWTNSNEVTLFD